MKYRLGDICSITKGATGIMKAVPGEYEMVTLGEEHKTHNEYQFDAKAVIIPLVSSTGHGHASMKHVKYCEGKFALGTILCAVIPHDENFVLAKYLRIYLHWNREELLVSQMKGMANVSLPMNRIANVEVIVPSIEKQQYIVDLEAKLVKKGDALDRLFAEQITQLENLTQAILQEAVQGKLVPQDPNDEPATELLKRIKEEKEALRQAQGTKRKEKPLPPIKPEEIPFEIPDSWMWCRLGEIVDIKGGKRVRNGYKLLKNPTDHIYIRVTDMKNGSISDNDIHYIDKNMFEVIKQYTIKKEDLYITIAGTIGKVGEVPEKFDGANLTENAAKLFFDNVLLNKTWLKNILTSEHCQFQFLDKAKKVTAQPKLALTRIATVLIPLPPLLEQKRIVAEIEKQLAKTEQLKKYITSNQEATEQLLKALLHEAFEGGK
ncbi:MAG TPA: restriction endonuclease subunit S [Bacteroidales bacterium]|nr:restriction endonuclease subunit S [Bacteroidales bacterium]HOR60138.1 restriction endonuclease subunit S [Bacteroidales bacterium]HPL04567.1 restriction endonuclease subunit S [Bacteroidales bacterium]